MVMATQNTNKVDGTWTVFIEILSDEFIAKTGVGAYAHITPVDLDYAYHQYQLRKASMRQFARDYVRPYA
jgi:hypothetical protein